MTKAWGRPFLVALTRRTISLWTNKAPREHFEPVDFVARLAALIPKPRVNLTRYHGVLAPNHRCRGLVTPARRGKGIKSIANAEVRTPAERHAAMTWGQARGNSA